jgi:DNA-binding CsgD family transcriptional regulator
MNSLMSKMFEDVSSVEAGFNDRRAARYAAALRSVASAIPMTVAATRGGMRGLAMFFGILFVATFSFAAMLFVTRLQVEFSITPVLIAADFVVGLLLNLIYALTLTDSLVGTASDPFWFYFVGTIALLVHKSGVRIALASVTVLALYDVSIQQLANERRSWNGVVFISARVLWLLLAVVAMKIEAGRRVSHVANSIVAANPEIVRCAESLTSREREVLTLVASGRLDKEVAKELGISVRTVHTYLDRIRQKVGVRRRPELVRFAIESGLPNLGSADD